MPYKDKNKQKEYRKKQYQREKANNTCRSAWSKVRDILPREDFQRWRKSKSLLLTNLRIEKRWKFLKTFMVTNGCSCGEQNISKLTFHHIDPNNKEMSIRRTCAYSKKTILEELTKGITKCKNCHTILHNGTSESHEQKLINKYKQCRPKKRHKHKNRLLIWYFKKEHKCQHCSMDNPICLLSHHIDSNTKEYKISWMFEQSRDTIDSELSKTIFLCQNCHEEFHYIYGTKTTKEQLEEYTGKKIIPININIKKYTDFLPDTQ